MNDRAVITGTFSEAKFVKTRSVMVICVEIPIESADMAFRILGGVPQPGREVPVAVARLNGQTEPKAKKGYLAREAAMACDTPAFRVFLNETHQHIEQGTAAQMVRSICGVESRAEFDTDPAKGRLWQQLHGKYLGWRQQ